MGTSQEKRVCLGAITGAHGIKGAVRIKSFTEQPKAVLSYGELTDKTGERTFTLSPAGQGKGVILAFIDGVSDRNAAEALKGTELFIDRSCLPETDEESFYHTDLIGLAVYYADKPNIEAGYIKAVQNHGAGDILEIQETDGKQSLLPFTKANVPTVDLDAGKIVALRPVLVDEDIEKEVQGKE